MKTLKTALVLTLVGLLCGALIGLTNYITEPIIRKNEEKKALAAYQGFFDLDKIEETAVEAEYVYLYVKILNNSETVGHVFKAKGKNERGLVDIMLALDAEGSIKGGRILNTENTPGFYDLYEDKNGNLKGIQGETISNLAGIDEDASATQTHRMLDALLKDIKNVAPNYIQAEEVSVYEVMFGAHESVTEDNEFVATELVIKKEIIKDEDGNILGYAYTATGLSDEVLHGQYHDEFESITLLVGIDTDGKVKGVITLESNHTPGFYGKYGEKLQALSGVDKDDLNVDLDTDASISGRLINRLLNAVKEVA